MCCNVCARARCNEIIGLSSMAWCLLLHLRTIRALIRLPMVMGRVMLSMVTENTFRDGSRPIANLLYILYIVL